MNAKEIRELETLAFDVMVDAKQSFYYMEGRCHGTRLRPSLPGKLPCSRSKIDVLLLYQRGRGPRKNAGPPKVGGKLYKRAQLKVIDKSEIVSYCDGYTKRSNHQGPDEFLSQDLRGEGRAMDCGLRLLKKSGADDRFIYDDEDAPEEAQELFAAWVDYLKELGWEWGYDLWEWDRNHLQKP